MKLKIGSDKDGVLARCAERYLEILEEKFSIYLPVGEVNHYFFEENHPDITKDISEVIIKKYMTGREQANMVPIKKGFDCLISLKEKIDLWIITSTYEYEGVKKDLFEWCSKNGLEKYRLIVTQEKEKWVKDLELDIMIEDRGDVALKIARTCPFCKVLLFNRPWNRHIVTAPFPNLLRCSDWYDINKVLNKEIQKI